MSSSISWAAVPTLGQTYGFAICSLMEMQWQHCSYIHSAEYFHGPFEATQDGVFYFLQMGSSECRPMDERALAFLETHTDTLMVLDAKEYGMEAVPASVRAYLDSGAVLRYELRAACSARAMCSITTPTSAATWALLSTRKDGYHGF